MERIELDNALIDLRVPANLASRYRVRLAEVTRDYALLELAFLPALFRKGILTSCPADLTVVVGSLVIQVRGVFHPEDASGHAAARFDYDGVVEPREIEMLRSRRPREGRTPESAAVEPAPVRYAS